MTGESKRDDKVKPILKKKGPEKHVHFDGAVSQASPKPLLSTAKPQKKATKFGQGKAKPVRDLLVLVVALGALMLVTMNFDTTGKEEDIEEEEVKEDIVADTLNGWAQSVADVLQKQTGRTPRTTECSIFLTVGSIPGTGFTLYAGKDYDIGDVVYSEAKGILPIGSFALPLHAFLLKHHPSLENVDGKLFMENGSGDVSDFQLRATRPIHSGEELFVNVHQHPSSHVPHPETFFSDIPSDTDYALADSIIDDAIVTARNMAYVHRKKSLKLNKDFIFSLLRRSVRKVNPRAGALLPGTALRAKERKGVSSSLVRLQNRTKEHHDYFSYCLDDIQSGSREDGSRTIRTAKSFKKGEIITTVPLYITSDLNQEPACETSEECPVTAHPFVSYCWSSPGISATAKFCPLTEVIFLSRDDESGTANVELRWRKDDEFEGSTLDELQIAPVAAVAWDIVALQTIEDGQEVSFNYLLPDD